MKIYRPVKSNFKTQSFGDSQACVKVNAAGQAVRPYKVVNKSGNFCKPGYKDFYTTVLGMKGHNGEDWTTKFKEPCYFPVEAGTGWFAKSASDTDGGIGVDVFSKKRIHFPALPTQAGPQAKAEWKKYKGMMYVKFRFWHFHSFTVSKKAVVKLGQLIGYCDSTGASSGDHLHWSMKFVDEGDRTLDAGNGYSGAVDFSAYYTNTYILDELAKSKETKAREAQKEEIRKDIAEAVELTKALPEEQQPPFWERILRAIKDFISLP